jgi:hypothetical protein
MKHFLGLILFFSISPLVFSQTTDKKLQTCMDATVMITTKAGTSGGSGFIVRSDKVGEEYHNVVVTAAHLFSGVRMYIKVQKYEGEPAELVGYDTYESMVYDCNDKHDLAVMVFTSKKQMSTVEIDFDTSYYFNTPIFHLGYGMLDDLRIDSGEITMPKTFLPACFKGLIRCNCHTIFGDSGGPLFLKENHKVIGVCHAIRACHGQYLTKHAYFIPIRKMKTWNTEQNNGLRFVYIPAQKLPVIPYIQLTLRNYEIEEPSE